MLAGSRPRASEGASLSFRSALTDTAMKSALAPVLAGLLVAACGGSEEKETPAPSPVASGAGAAIAHPSPGSRIEVAAPERRIRGAIDNEALSETVDGWFQALGNKIRIRDFDGIADAFSSDLLAEPLFPEFELSGSQGAQADLEHLPLGVERYRAPAPTRALGKAAFIESIENRIGPLARLSQSRWRLTSASFEKGPRRDDVVRWGRAEASIHIVGHALDRGTVVLDAKAVARIENRGGDWVISALRMEERTLLYHERPMFSEVSRAAGVAYDGLRYGEPGNDGDGWNGAATADVDGDGLLDIFVPGAQRGFLYRNTADGAFVEEAEARGLAGTGGGTGAVFFDYDRDGDQDLAVAHVGWLDLANKAKGRALELYENDGKGRFKDVSAETLVGKHSVPAYSLTAFDANGDGFTDLFACGYGRMDFEINDSWIEASNGAPDLLLMNRGGTTFEDMTVAAGMADKRWSYASAAADYDEDGDQDLFVANNFGTSRLWRNRGDGTFEDAAEELGVNVRGNVMGALWTDLNGDGRLDLYLASPTSTSGSRLLGGVEERRGSNASQGMIQMANGNKVFLGGVAEGGNATFQRGDIGGTRSGWAWSAASPDIDLDGTRDIVCVNGFVTGDLSGDT